MVKISVKALCAILFGISLIFRFYFYSNHVNFAQDQARDLMIVEEMAGRGTHLLAYGSKASVADFHWPPLYYQILMGVGRLTNFNPLAPHWFFVIAESITPIFLFLTLKYFYKKPLRLVNRFNLCSITGSDGIWHFFLESQFDSPVDDCFDILLDKLLLFKKFPILNMGIFSPTMGSSIAFSGWLNHAFLLWVFNLVY